jgi:hypothetical protein
MMNAVGSYLSGEDQASAQQNAANLMYNAQMAALKQQQQQWQTTQDELQPWLKGGTAAENLYASLTQPGGPTNLYTAFEGTPNYQFAQKEAAGALGSQNAALGNYFSGAGGLGLTAEAGTLASQNYNQYIAQLQNASGMGQNAGNTLGGLGTTYANMFGQDLTGAAGAQGAGLIGSANARSAMLNNMGSNFSPNPYSMLSYQQLGNMIKGAQDPYESMYSQYRYNS